MNPPLIVSWLLWPLSLIYGAWMMLRAWAYRRGIFKSKRVEGIVVSIGNLTTGGTGKTPTALWLALRAADAGQRAAILLRGYGSRGEADADGRPRSDEAALLRDRLAGRAQLGIGPDRIASAEVLARHGVTWFVLDDGFQHLKLRRDVDIVLLDASRPFGNGRLLPAGALREPRSALRRADMILITRSDRAPALETAVRHYAKAPVFYARARLDGLYRAPQRAVALPRADWARGRFFAFAGIGNPAAFFDDLGRWGVPLAGTRSFRDHHRFTPADLAQIERAAIEKSADALVCTEKDVFNLSDITALRLPIYAACISMAIDGEERFWESICRIANQRASEAAR
ncbi:MAG: tetraacyldisaccharide 4'-kinase [Candidatus Acidiferrales bacterium]